VSADFDGDGRLDLAVANQWSNDISILIGDGSGGFAAPVQLLVGAYPVGILSRDLNADGIPDLAVTNQAGNSLSVLLGDGSGGFVTALSGNR